MERSTLRSTLATVLVASSLAGCATGPRADPRDPLEPLNRRVDQLNEAVDKAVLKPAATAYEQVVPRVARIGVSNFFGNLGDPWSAVNSLLQLKVAQAAQNATRFAINTLLGLGGVLDIATDAKLERHKEDFGTTLGHWGVPSGPYLVLPLLGPSTLRDSAALPVDWVGNPVGYVTPPLDRNLLIGASVIDARARLLPMDPTVDSAIDRYTFRRDSYLQYRKARISGSGDGQVEALEGAEAVEAVEGQRQ